MKTLAESLEKSQNEGKLWLLLLRVVDRLGDLNEQQCQKLLLGVYDITTTMGDERYGPLDLRDLDIHAMRLGWHILERLPKENRFGFLTKIFDSTKSVYSPVHLVAVLNQKMERCEGGEGSDATLVTKNEIAELNKLCVEAIRKAAQDGSLAENKHFCRLLYRWKEWGEEEEAKDYTKKLMNTNLFALLKGFVQEPVIATAGDPVSRKIRRIGTKNLMDFIDIAELNEKIAQIDESELNEEETELLELYKNPPPDPFGGVV